MTSLASGSAPGHGEAFNAQSVALIGLALGEVETWAAAVATESQLALEKAQSFKSNMLFVKVHGYMLALALRNLLRTVEWAIRQADNAKDGDRSKKLRAARERFDSEVPNAVKFRDVVEYLDNYVGQWGDRKHKDVRNIAVYLERSSAGTVRLHLADDLELDVRRAAEAAAELAGRVQEVLHE